MSKRRIGSDNKIELSISWEEEFGDENSGEILLKVNDSVVESDLINSAEDFEQMWENLKEFLETAFNVYTGGVEDELNYEEQPEGGDRE